MLRAASKQFILTNSNLPPKTKQKPTKTHKRETNKKKIQTLLNAFTFNLLSQFITSHIYSI